MENGEPSLPKDHNSSNWWETDVTKGGESKATLSLLLSKEGDESCMDTGAYFVGHGEE